MTWKYSGIRRNLPSMEIEVLTFNGFQENTYILYDETKECLILDPGCCDRYEEKEFADLIESKGLKPVLLLNTHCHIDHVLGNYFVKEKYNIPFKIHKVEEPYLRAVKTYAHVYGYFNYTEQLPDGFVEEGEKIRFGNTELDVIFTPGHSGGHFSLFHRKEKKCFSGDVLFYRSIGRTDLPGGDHLTLLKTIHEKIFTLGDDVVVYPGHGPTTIIEDEKKFNPYCSLKA